MSHIRSIPPITSTGRRKNNLLGKLLDNNLTHISLGRKSSERRQGFGVGKIKKDDEDPWDISQHQYQKPKPKKTTVSKIQYEPKIECITDIYDSDNKEDFNLILQFKGIKFLNQSFTQGGRDEKNSRIFYTPISYKGNTAYLVLSTKGDIFESEVVPQKKGIDQLFSNEFYFPDLIKTYDPLSMKVQQNNGLTIISYNRKKE